MGTGRNIQGTWVIPGHRVVQCIGKWTVQQAWPEQNEVRKVRSSLPTCKPPRPLMTMRETSGRSEKWETMSIRGSLKVSYNYRAVSSFHCFSWEVSQEKRLLESWRSTLRNSYVKQVESSGPGALLYWTPFGTEMSISPTAGCVDS